jgi:hypothetical protein
MNQELIRSILTDDPIPAILDGGGRWTRVYGRQSPTAMLLVYEPESGPRNAVAVCLSDGGRTIVQSHWSADPALPALGGLIARHPHVMPVRYRPGKRCTLRDGNLFLKCVADDRGAMINRDARILHFAAQQGQLGFGVARPAGWLAKARIIVQHRVPGVPVIERLWSEDGPKLAARLGAANASLVAAPIIAPIRFTYADQMRRTEKYAKRLGQYLPRSAPLCEALFTKLARIAPGPADRPTHGAPHAHQWLDGPDGLMLVDFDRFGLSDPELDVATFVAETDFESSCFAGLVGEAFRESFEARWALNRNLFNAYRVHKHIAKALRTATALRIDASDRALEIISNAEQFL